MFNSFKVRTRIYTGFGAIVALGAVLSAFSLMQLNNVGQQVGKLDALSGNVSRVLEARHVLEAIRRGETQLRLAADPAVSDEIRSNIARAKTLMVDAASATLSGDRRRLYNGVDASLTEHQELLDQLVGLAAVQAGARSRLFSGGDALTAATNMLMGLAGSSAGRNDDAAKADVNAAVLLVRIANWRYLATGDKKGPANFGEKVRKARAALTALTEISGQVERTQEAVVSAAMDTYEAAFQSYAASWSKGIALDDDSLRPGIVSMQEKLEEANLSLQDSFAAISFSSKDTVSRTTWLQEVLAAFGLAISVVTAWLIGRSVIAPVSRLTSTMIGLAQGDTGVKIGEVDRSDEIGEMAGRSTYFETRRSKIFA